MTEWLLIAAALFVLWVGILLVRLRWDPNLSRRVLTAERKRRRNIRHD